MGLLDAVTTATGVGGSDLLGGTKTPAGTNLLGPPAKAAGGTNLLGPAPAAVKAGVGASGGGHGGGILGSIIHAITGVPKGIAELGKEVGMAGVRGSENLLNDAAYVGTLGKVGGATGPHLGGRSGTPDYNSSTGKVGLGASTIVAGPDAVAKTLREQYPLLEAQRAGLVTTGEHAGGLGQLVASAATGGQLHPLGQNLQNNLVRDYRQNPVGAGLNDALNAAIIGGPVADLGVAAHVPGAGALKGVTEAASHVAAAPILPYRALALGADLGRLPLVGEALAAHLPGEGNIPGVLEAGRRVADATGTLGSHQLAEGTPGPVTGFLGRSAATGGRALGNTIAKADARGFLREAGVARDAAVGQAARNAGLTQAELGVEPRAGRLGAALRSVAGARDFVRDPEMEHALQLRQVGAVPAIIKALDSGAAGGALLESEGISPRTAVLAAGRGTPLEEQHLQSAAAIRSPFIEQRGEEELAGVGRLNGPMNPEQAGSTPLSQPVRSATAVPDAAAKAAEDALTAHRTAQGLPATAAPAPPPMSDVEAQQLAERLGIPVEAVKAAEAVRSSPQPADLTALTDQAKTLRGAADQARAAAETDIANAPARYRPALALGQRIADGLHAAAAEADKAAPGSGDLLREDATSIPTTLKALVDAGIDPQHLIGGREPTPRTGLFHRGESLPQLRKLSSESQKTEGTIPGDLQVTAQREARRAGQVIANVTALPFQEKYGTTVGELGVQPADLGRAGYTAWDPRSWTSKVPAESIGADTPVIPTKLFETFKDYWQPKTREPGGIVDRYDALVRGGKTLTLALNPAYHAAIIVGNVIRNIVVGGVDPYTLAKNMVEGAKLLKEQAHSTEQIIPAELTGGLTTTEGGTLGRGSTKGPLAKVLSYPGQRGYALTSWAEQVQRLGLHLSKLEQGFTPEQAIRETLKISGDFRNLSPFEQAVVKRVVPGYAWLKVITNQAMRLPLENPLRTAWLFHIGQQAQTANTGETAWPLSPLGLLATVPRLALPIQATLAAGAGVNVTKGRALTRPQVNDSAGNPVPTTGPLLGRPGGLRELGHVVSGMFPQGRLVGALTQANVHRYDTGEPVLSKSGTGKGGSIPFPGGTGEAVLHALGLAPPTKTLTKAGANATKAKAKAGNTYSTRLKAYKGGGK